VDIYEKEDSFVLEADIPGVPLQGVEVEVKDDALHIKGSTLPEERGPSDLFLVQERPSGVFHRVFSLPVDAEHDKVRAKLKNGVLRVIVPKKEAAKRKQITVDAP
jgi:HSP20 family protein